MTQGYIEFPLEEPFLTSHPKLLSNDKNALTWNADATFPANALTGMPAYRTDEGKLYIYRNGGWELLINFSDLPLTQKNASQTYLTKTDADNKFLTKNDFTTAHAEKANKSHTHALADILQLAVTYLSRADAEKLYLALHGTADAALKATKDSQDRVIVDTYATKEELENKSSVDDAALVQQLIGFYNGMTGSTLDWRDYTEHKPNEVLEAFYQYGYGYNEG